MKVKKPILWILIVIVLCIGAFLIYDRGRPAPLPTKRTLYEGVTYQRIVHVTPHPLIAHVIVIDRKTADIGFRITSYNVCYTKLLRDHHGLNPSPLMAI